MRIDAEAKAFLKREARIAFKALEFQERQRIGSYKVIFKELCEAWRAGATIEFPPGWKERHREMEASEEVDENLALHKLYGGAPEMSEGEVVMRRSVE